MHWLGFILSCIFVIIIMVVFKPDMFFDEL